MMTTFPVATLWLISKGRTLFQRSKIEQGSRQVGKECAPFLRVLTPEVPPVLEAPEPNPPARGRPIFRISIHMRLIVGRNSPSSLAGGEGVNRRLS
jgi:hypothetical protein